MSDAKIIGIDLGTTNSAVGVIDSGFPVLIPDDSGSKLTPSLVAWDGDKVSIVGAAARRFMTHKPESVFYSTKRFMGKRWQDLKADALGVSYGVIKGRNGEVVLKSKDSTVLPEEVAAEVLKKLKSDAEAYLGCSVSKAVITVPAYFNDGQRLATKRAGELAGLEVERVINEPTAAALAFGLGREKDHLKCVVYDLGGGTFDVSILELRGDVFEVLATNGNTQLGGDDIDEALVVWLQSEVEEQLGAQLTKEELGRLRGEVERVKCELSDMEKSSVELPFLRKGFSFQREIQRSELERVARPVVERTREHCLRALQDSKLKLSDLDRVVVVGGQTRMPLVRSLVKDIFGQDPDVSVNPDEAVAVGASVQAGMLSGAMQNVVLLDVTPLSLGVETFGGLMNVIIPRNSTIPTKAGELFTNAVDGQTSMAIHVLQGERELAKDNWSLGEMKLAFQSGPRGSAKVGVQFEIDADGVLQVLARDVQTGEEQIITLNSAVDVDDEAVEQMVSESVDHALEDMNERRWIEAEMKAQRQIEAAQKALKVLGSEIDEKLKGDVVQVLNDIVKVFEEKNLAQLKLLLVRLDEETKPLAEMLMDKAVELALKKKGVF